MMLSLKMEMLNNTWPVRARENMDNAIGECTFFYAEFITSQSVDSDYDTMLDHDSVIDSHVRKMGMLESRWPT